MNSVDGDELYELILSLQTNRAFDHPIEHFKLIQTHISYILLTGPLAYKFKKPVNLGFLDFTSLEKRRFFLDEELRLNRRLAPDLYQGVVAIYGTIAAPTISGSGKAIEYALKLTQFKQDDQLDEVLDAGRLTRELVDQLAKTIADFHASIPVAIQSSDYGAVERIREHVLANFDHIVIDTKDDDLFCRFNHIKSETERKLDLLNTIFKQRKQQGYIRECHGDSHRYDGEN